MPKETRGPVQSIFLPDFSSEYTQLQRDTRVLYGDFIPANKRGEFKGMPYITVLSFKPGVVLDSFIRDALSVSAEQLIGLDLEIGGFGEFVDDERRVLFLRVTPQDVLTEIYDQLVGKLNGRVRLKGPSYVPHCTVGRKYGYAPLERYRDRVEVIRERFDAVRWPFKVQDVRLLEGDGIPKLETAAA
jgi:hypothetical protein